ncbi:MAG: CpaE family protein [Pseudorhodobacter sp.]
MSSIANLQPQPAPIRACTISRDVQNFDLLIEDMETELGESWGDLSFEDALTFLQQPEAGALEFVAIAVDGNDSANPAQISEIIRNAKTRDVKVVLIAHEVSPVALHQLLRLGADDFVPYPLPKNALHEAIGRMHKPPPKQAGGEHVNTPGFRAKGDRNAVILPVHGMSGGVGASTFAVNLAWELATVTRADGPRVCLLDLDFQFGAISTYLDLPRRETVIEILQDAAATDNESFLKSMLTFNDRLHVFTAPPDMLPLDIVAGEDLDHLLDIAQANFDFVVIDMPTSITGWTETILNRAHVYFALMELDLRSAQNTLRLVRALKSEGLPAEKLRYILNRAPKFTDLSAKSRVKRMAESLDIDIEVQLPDGGAQVTQANDHGLPLAESAAKNTMRKEIAKLAKSLFDLDQTTEAKA